MLNETIAIYAGAMGHVDVVAIAKRCCEAQIALLAVPLGNRYWQGNVVMWLGDERTG